MHSKCKCTTVGVQNTTLCTLSNILSRLCFGSQKGQGVDAWYGHGCTSSQCYLLPFHVCLDLKNLVEDISIETLLFQMQECSVILRPSFVFTPQLEKGLGYCFHPWHPAGQAVGRAGGRPGDRAAANILSGLDLSNYKGQGVDTWQGHWLGRVGVQV